MSYAVQHLARAGAIAEEAVASGLYTSVIIAVGNQSGLVWQHLVPGPDNATTSSLFRIASITKPIMATAVMRLVEQGYLLLNDPVARFIPDFAQHGKEAITTWHLLTHTSGLDNDETQARLLFEQRAPRRAYLDMVCATPLHFESGSRYEYCNQAFIILAELITRLSGQDYPDYLRQHLFAPLGMHDTGFDPADANRALPIHDWEDTASPAYLASLAHPAGGLWSTVADLQALGRAFLKNGRAGDHHLLSPSTIETMTRVHTSGLMNIVDGQPRPAVAGLGWGKRGPTGVLLASERSFGHGGATGAFLWIDPAYDQVYVFLANPRQDHPDIGRQRDATRAMNVVYAAHPN